MSLWNRTARFGGRRPSVFNCLAIATNDRPVVIDFVVSADAMVWPMVPQGVSNSYVQYARDHAPSWEGDETPDGKDADLAIPPLPDAGAPR